MSERTKSLLIKYGITVGACLTMTTMHLLNADFLNLEGEHLLRVLSDAFLVPGLLCVFSGLLIWLGNEGSFDGIGYALSYAFHAIMPGPLNKRESYKDYLARKKGKEPMGFAFLLIVGVVFTVIALVFSALFHMQ